MSGPGAGLGPIVGSVEVLNRAGSVMQRIAWDGHPLRIGRAYDNDLVVADPYVCPHHLELTSGGDGIAARDLGSVNGTYLDRGRERIGRVLLADGMTLHFGHSQLRFHAAGGKVAATLRDTARHGMLGRLGTPWMLAVASLSGLIALAVNELLGTAEETGALALGGELLYPVIGVILWSGFWSLLNRVISHRASFNVHLNIALLGVTVLFLVAQSISMVGFALGWTDSVWWLRLLGRIAVLCATVYAHLRYVLHDRSLRLFGIAALASTLMFGTPATGELIERNEFSNLPYLEPLLWPPSFRAVNGERVDEFMGESEVLKRRVERDVRD